MDRGEKRAVTLNEDFRGFDDDLLALAMTEYSQPLLRYCHSMVRDYQEAQDLVQTIFIKIYQKGDGFQQGTSFSAWLFQIAYHACLDQLRQQKRDQNRWREVAAQAQMAQPYPAPSEMISEEILALLGKLSPLDRSLLYGRIMEERSFKELSDIHSKNEAALRKRYERARKKFSALLNARAEANENYLKGGCGHEQK